VDWPAWRFVADDLSQRQWIKRRRVDVRNGSTAILGKLPTHVRIPNAKRLGSADSVHKDTFIVS
jgi:hypothetical protein